MADNRDTIRERIFSAIDDKYDKNTGSLVWEQSQGIAIELESEYVIIDDGLNQAFAGTADFENLKIKAFEKGVDWKEATKSSGQVLIVGTVGTEISVGTLVASELNQYSVTEPVVIGTDGTVLAKVECTEAGITGNTLAGTIVIFPKTLIGLNTVTNPADFVNGYAEETRDELLKRYYIVIRKPATSGNAYHYEQWALEVTDVGDVKVKSLWAGGGTVKVVIIDRNKIPATTELLNAVATYIESVRPIGVNVTVTTAEELSINVNCVLTLKAGYTLEAVQASIEEAFTTYFKSITFVDTKVIYAKMGNIIYEVDGVEDLDYATFTINSGAENIELEDSNTRTQIPTLGIVTASLAV